MHNGMTARKNETSRNVRENREYIKTSDSIQVLIGERDTKKKTETRALNLIERERGMQRAGQRQL